MRGGGIEESDKFDVVTVTRARRFFHTVSQLLEVGGNLIATTIDARVVMERMMDTGYYSHFKDETGNERCHDQDGNLVVAVGDNACQLKFPLGTVKRLFQKSQCVDENGISPDHFGLEYTFTLIEGQDHAAGVGQAVDLPEWLIPLPVMTFVDTLLIIV